MSAENPQRHYVMGHDDRERRRLALQASIINPLTGDLLRRAGIAPGMRVLDLGCGIGEVAMLAASLVGRHGQVIGVDFDEPALAIARARTESQFSNVEFVHADIAAYRPTGHLDAVVGRHILIHTPDVTALLARVLALLDPGGVAVFHEYDFATIQATYPASALNARCTALFSQIFARGPQGNIGSRLYHLLAAAGFEVCHCRGEFPIDGGPQSPFYEWYAESLRSAFPRAVALGLAAADEFDFNVLAGQLRDEAVGLGSSCPAPVMVGCVARKPAARA